MRIAIPKEQAPDERRVAATPDTVSTWVEGGFEVSVEAGCGDGAGFSDAMYADAGATVVDTAAALYGQGDIVVKLEPPAVRADGTHEVDLMREGAVLVSFVWPKRHPELLEKLAARKISAVAMDAVPRITTAQKLDALSSMANLAGYRAVIEAANHYPSMFSGSITAAGRVHPAKVLVIGAGVAGLAAIAAARGLGAIVRAFDTRDAARDQVKSLGAEFLELDYEEDGDGGGGYAKVMSKAFIEAEMALFLAQAPEIDIVITTALVPGTKAPVLWNQQTVEAMKPGSVVVDLAASQGGNCEVTVKGQVITHAGVTVIGHTDLTSRVAPTASQLYGTNVRHLLAEMGGAEGFTVDLENIIVRTALVAHDGAVTWPPPKPTESTKPAPAPAPAAPAKAPPAAAPAAPAPVKAKPAAAPKSGGVVAAGIGLALVALWAWLRFGPAGEATLDEPTRELLQHLTVFVLACFVGWQIIWNVSAALHTPLMSVTNAISGIIIVGGILGGGHSGFDAATVLALLATGLAMINVVGGFMVTHRMLKMFRK